MNNDAAAKRLPVLIAGAGPTGLFLAIELAVAGVRPLVIERLTEPDLTIKAGAVGAVGGEALERRGLGPAIEKVEQAAFAAMLPEVRAAMTANPFKKIGGNFSGLFFHASKEEPDRRFRGVMQAPLEKMLADDPADHRGILSWNAQGHDRHLHEAGSYGELLEVAVPPEALAKAAAAGELVIRFEVSDALPGGLAIYGAHFGRYPLDPTLVFVTK